MKTQHYKDVLYVHVSINSFITQAPLRPVASARGRFVLPFNGRVASNFDTFAF